MSIFWSIVKGLNDALTNTLKEFSTSSEVKEVNYREELEKDWLKHLYNCSDEELDKYCDYYGLYRSVKENGRYTCEHVIARYCADHEIQFYYIY